MGNILKVTNIMFVFTTSDNTRLLKCVNCDIISSPITTLIGFYYLYIFFLKVKIYYSKHSVTNHVHLSL